MKTNHYLEMGKICLALLVSIFIVKAISSVFFIDNSPSLNTKFIASLFQPKASTNKTIANVAIEKKANFKELEAPLNQFNQIVKGVYAKEDKENNITYIRIENDVEYEERKVKLNIDGVVKEYTISIPKGTLK